MERTDETRRRDLVSRGWSDERRRQFGGRDGIDARLNRVRSPIPAERGMIAGKFIWETLSLRTIVGRGEAMRIEA